MPASGRIKMTSWRFVFISKFEHKMLISIKFTNTACGSGFLRYCMLTSGPYFLCCAHFRRTTILNNKFEDSQVSSPYSWIFTPRVMFIIWETFRPCRHRQLFCVSYCSGAYSEVMRRASFRGKSCYAMQQQQQLSVVLERSLSVPYSARSLSLMLRHDVTPSATIHQDTVSDSTSHDKCPLW